jgi:hypothetical protein
MPAVSAKVKDPALGFYEWSQPKQNWMVFRENLFEAILL